MLEKLLQHLNETLGPDWPSYELETILYDFPEVSDVLVDQILVLRNLVLNPALFWTDPLFFLFSIAPLNGETADFSYLPSPNSLEVAKALVEVKKITGERPASNGVKLCILRCLEDDGYSVAPYPFTLISDKFPLAPGQTTEDIQNKAEALDKVCSMP